MLSTLTWWRDLASSRVRLAEIPGSGDDAEPGARTASERSVDGAVCLLAVVAAALFLSPELREAGRVLSTGEVLLDASCGLVAGVALWWRRRWPVGVALVCLAMGTVSVSATAPGLVSLFSLALHRPARPALLVTALWAPAVALFAALSPTTDALSSLAVVMPLALAATAWGMFVRARSLLLSSLRDRALRAEANQQLHEDRARMAERTRIAREMHDVLAHRISLLALHAGGLEVRPDLPAGDVQATATLMRSTARQALEELRSVIGVLRETGGATGPAAPQPTLRDIGRLIEERRSAGTLIEFDMELADPDAVPDTLGRDAYRIVQEALTNVGKHASRSTARVLVSGSPGFGLHVSIRNPASVTTSVPQDLPGAGAGLLGLQERVQLTGGTLVHGLDGAGDFVVEADLRW